MMTMPAPKMIPPIKLAPSKPPEVGGASVVIAVIVLTSVIVVEIDVVAGALVVFDVTGAREEVASDVVALVKSVVGVYVVPLVELVADVTVGVLV